MFEMVILLIAGATVVLLAYTLSTGLIQCRDRSRVQNIAYQADRARLAALSELYCLTVECKRCPAHDYCPQDKGNCSAYLDRAIEESFQKKHKPKGGCL